MKKRVEDVVVVVETADWIKWWDALEYLTGNGGKQHKRWGLQLARESRHPDAQWLASFFPEGAAIGTNAVRDAVWCLQDEDLRAMYLLYMTWGSEEASLVRSAERGYAVAQAEMALRTYESEAFAWATKAAEQGDRRGLWRLGECYERGWGNDAGECDAARAIELFREAAHLGCPEAQSLFGQRAYEELDWQRYLWWGNAAARGVDGYPFCIAVFQLLPLFKRGECGRILHTAALYFRSSPHLAKRGVAERAMPPKEVYKFGLVLELHQAMLRRAKRALDCWSVASRRLGMARDIRLMIARMAWEEMWRWGEKENKETKPTV